MDVPGRYPTDLKRVADTVRDRIADGTYPLETYLPPIGKLREEFWFARQTVGRGLQALEKEGLIKRFKGKGYWIIAKPGE